jgi:hypothetical protein
MNVDCMFYAASKLKFNSLIKFKSYYISYSLLRLICESNIGAWAETHNKKVTLFKLQHRLYKNIFYYLQRVLMMNI